MDREKDILQIRKYLKGELDARAMHELERRALDDPFLMDALEGYEQTTDDQQKNLDELSGRLKQRVAQKEARIIPWRPLSIAASILIIIGAGIWFLSGNQPEKTPKLARDIKVEKEEQPALSAPSKSITVDSNKSTNNVASNIAKTEQPRPKQYSDVKKDSVSQLAVNADKASVAVEPPAVYESAEKQAEVFYKPKKDSVAANEMIVTAMGQKKQADKLKEAAKPSETLVQSKAEGVSATPAGGTGRTINGMVIGSDDRQPIVGATVKVAGRPFGVVTNVQGKFTLQDVASDQTLTVNYIGYNAKKVSVSKKDSLTISLDPNNSSLSEVVVTGYGIKKDADNETAIEDARPKDGWHSFNQYLKQNAVSPDGKTGKVKVSFTVAANGTISQIKIVKSLSDAADKKAIDLINNGPEWAGSTDGKTKEVKVSVSFHQ